MKMRFRFRLGLSVLLLLGVVAILQHHFFRDPDSHTLRVALKNQITSLDPARAFDLTTGEVVYQIYESLYEYNYLKRPYTIQPLLAESLPQISNDGRTYTIPLKKGILYHAHSLLTARTVTCQDFINQIKRLALPSLASSGFWLVDGLILGLDTFIAQFPKEKPLDIERFLTTPVAGLKCLNETTLSIELTRPYTKFLYHLAISHFSPLPAEAISALKNNFDKEDLGTGPFQLATWNTREIILNRNPNYKHSFYPTTGDRFAHQSGLLQDAGKPLPFLETIRFYVEPSHKNRWQLFLDRKVDLVDFSYKHFSEIAVPKESQQRLKEVVKEYAPSLTFWWLAFNMKDPLVGKNLNLRLAIAHAVNRDLLIERYSNNMGLKANSLYPPGIPGYSPASQLPIAFDLKKAKSYLAQSGVDPKKIQLTFDTRGNDETNLQKAQFVKEQLAQIGIDLKIVVNSFSEFLRRSEEGQMQFWQGGWALDFPDATNVLDLLYSKNFPPGPNRSFYSNPELDRLYEQITKIENGPYKNKLLEKAETIIMADLVWIPTYYERKVIYYDKRVRNFRYTDIVFNSYKYLKIDN